MNANEIVTMSVLGFTLFCVAGVPAIILVKMMFENYAQRADEKESHE